MKEKWTMFSTPKEELKQLLVSLGTCFIGEGFIQVKDYPFEPSIAYNQTLIKKEDIVDFDYDARPMTIRIKNELIFISIKHKEALIHFASKNKIKIVLRPAIWDLILEPFLDTEFTEEGNKRVTRLLVKYGLTPKQINQLRDEVEIQMLKYNFDTTLWEWCSLDASDVLKAMRLKYNHTDFRIFYKKVIDIALLSHP
ncbi:MAG: hypothetical protein LBE34_09335 [Flavobacteriaceae bacterium]|jgi:hypothetical protein|nr:hypothetical protein [Flavobacteriaceae bacterium]